MNTKEEEKLEARVARLENDVGILIQLLRYTVMTPGEVSFGYSEERGLFLVRDKWYNEIPY